MRVLITRPREDAEPLARELATRGIDAMIEPLLDIAYFDDMPKLAGAQAVLVTSANGIRALARLLPRRDIAVLAVGDASARVARELGYGRVESADGDVSDLARLVEARLRPEAGALVHVAGSVVAGDLAGMVRAAGFEYRRAVLYRTDVSEALSRSCADALRAGKIAAVLFFSPRTAATFVSLAQGAGLAAALSNVVAICLSSRVADRAARAKWKRIAVAEKPETGALLDLLATWAEAESRNTI